MNRIAAAVILATTFATTFATVLPACQQVPTTISPAGTPARTTVMPGRLQHIVLVDLEDDADIPRMRADSDRLLPTIPTVKGYVCGTHVETGRANVAHDYDLAIVVQFDSVEDYRAFLEHPVHQQLVREWRSKWRRSYIVDFAP
ncbi:MAG: Dabb family protein [Planctomycetota bacterium]|jgi:hypothetical protein|nr:MAG: Dabb family protein [Planctomycetota bacterium]